MHQPDWYKITYSRVDHQMQQSKKNYEENIILELLIDAINECPLDTIDDPNY